MFLRGCSETVTASVDMTQTIPEGILASFIELINRDSVELTSIDHVLKMFILADDLDYRVNVYIMSRNVNNFRSPILAVGAIPLLQ